MKDGLDISNELSACSRLLDIVARKLGHDWLLLMHGSWLDEEKCCRAVFGQYDNYGVAMLEANGIPVWLKNADAEGRLKSNEDMYGELTKLLYKTLKSGGKLSDGKREVDASTVPEFMVECDLLGLS